MRKSGLSVLVIMVVGASAGWAATPRFVLEIGHDTTRVNGPVLADGTIDYDAALWAEMSKGVTPENNAGPLFKRVEKMWKEYAAGVKSGEKWNQMDDELFKHAVKRPWKAEECPDVAAWLKANEAALALVVEASGRARLCGERPSSGDASIASQFKPGTFRISVMALTARAMERVARNDANGRVRISPRWGG